MKDLPQTDFPNATHTGSGTEEHQAKEEIRTTLQKRQDNTDHLLLSNEIDPAFASIGGRGNSSHHTK